MTLKPELRALLFAALVLAPGIPGCGSSRPPVPGSVDLAEGRYREAEAALRDALAGDPDNAELHFLLGRSLAAQGQAPEAVEQFEAALSLEPAREGAVRDERRRHQERYLDEARERIGLGEVEEAAPWVRSARAMVPDDPAVLGLEARIREGMGDVPGALDLYRTAYERDPRDEEVRRGLVRNLLAAGHEAYDREAYGEAWDLLTEAGEIDPGGDVHHLLGSIAYAWAEKSRGEERTRRLEDAVREFTAALDRDHEDDDSRFNLATTLFALGDYETSARLFNELASRNPENGDAFMALSRVHSLAGDAEAAVTEEAIGRALTVGDPIHEPDEWARRSAARFPRSDLAGVYRERKAPESIRTYTLPGGDAVEAWFYPGAGRIEVFRAGVRLGPPFLLLPR